MSVSARRRTNLQMVLVMLIIGVVNLIWAETLTVNSGFGWDGLNYGGWAKDFHQSVILAQRSEYYIQRVLPSAMVHYGMRAVLFPFLSTEQIKGILSANENILLGFAIYNLLLILLSVFVWGLIADRLKISQRGKWFGFLFVFVNYAILKNNFYHSVLTDTTAFALGVLAFYFFLAKKPIALLGVMLAGAFTWPTIAYTTALLLVFPYRADDPIPETSLERRKARKWSRLVAATVVFGSLLFFNYLGTDLSRHAGEFGITLQLNLSVLYLSVASVLAYLYFAVKNVVSDSRLFDLRHILRSLQWRWLIALGIFHLGLKLTIHYLANPNVGWGNMRHFVDYTFISSLTEPLIFLVAHTVYYGPVILLLVLFWKPFCESIGEYGIGLRLFVLLNVLLSIGPQSRYQIPAVSVFAIVLTRFLDRSVLQQWSLTFWAALSLFFSKMWYPFNTSPQVYDGTMESLQRFPLQHYFANSGPWMSLRMYLIHGSIILATGILLYFLLARKARGPTILRQSEELASS